MIQAVTSAGSDQPFHVGPLPGTGGAERASSMLMLRIRCWNSHQILSRSRSRYRGAVSSGNASTICCSVHPAVGCSVTLKVNDAAAMMSQHHKHEQHPKADRRHGEEVDRD